MTTSLNATEFTSLNDRLTGIVLLAITGFVVLFEWSGNTTYRYSAVAGILLFVIASMPRVIWSRRVFILTALALTISAYATRTDWLAITSDALNSAAFIAGFFTALTTLRSASASSPAIEKCGHFLAEQPPGRRYVALTIGGHLFALILNYGSISLLGNLAETSARREPNEEIRQHRIRRMLLAIQRGFVSTLPWSPLTFAIAISTSLVPGASWGGALAYCLVSAIILAGLGWALDTIFKPRLSVPIPLRQQPKGTWASILPLLALLLILVTIVGALHVTTGIRAVGVVMLVVPIISISWIVLQNLTNSPITRATSQIVRYTVLDLPSYRSELVLLTMAGFIGTMGSKLLSPIVSTSGVELTALPNWLVLVALVWVIPLAGQIGMNPILSVSLIAPLLPTSASMGITPAALVTALTAGWALSGASSPFTATTMLVGKIARVSAWRVGLSWNGAYTLLSALALSAWVAYITLRLDSPSM